MSGRRAGPPGATPPGDVGACAICDDPRPTFRWTDTHGVGACTRCGAPYRLYHYDEDGKRFEHAPTLMLRNDWVPITRRYWEENQRNCDPGAFNFGGSSYEVATREDFRVYNEWMEAHRHELPANATVAEG